MKKILTIIAGLFIIASIAFVASSTELFKGQAMGGGGGDHDLGGLGGDNKGGFDLTGGAGSATSTASATSGAGTASAGAATTTNSDDDDEPAISGTYSGPTGGTGGTVPSGDDDDDDDDDNGKTISTTAAATMGETAAFETGTTATTYEHSYAGSSGSDTKVKGSGSSYVLGTSATVTGSMSAEVKSAGASAEITTTISDYYVYLVVKDEEGNYVSGIEESDFNVSGGSPSDFSESTSYYTFRFEEEPSVKFYVEAEGYESESTGTISPEEGQQAVSEEVILTAIEYELQCSSLSMSPDEHEIAADATSVDDIEISIDVSGAMVEASIWPKFLMAFTINEWSGYVDVETTGDGSFTYNGDLTYSETSNGLQFTVINSDTASIELTYSGGAVGDTISASTESTCSDSFSITQTEAEDDGSDDTDEGSDDSGDEDSEDDDDGSDEDDEEDDDEEEKDDTTTDDIDYESITQKECEHDFEDVIDEEYEAVICRLAKSGVIDGYDYDHFGYYDYISVAEYIKVLMLLAGYDQSSSDSEILLSTNHWGEGWIAKAEELDTLRLRDGFSRNLDLPITRGDAALYAVRLAGVEYYPDSSPFSDVDPDDYFGYAVIFLGGTLVDVPTLGVQYALDAKTGDEFEPYDYISRGEAMHMLMNFYLALFES